MSVLKGLPPQMARRGQLKKNMEAPLARGREASTADGQSTGHPYGPALTATVLRMAGTGEAMGPGHMGAGPQGTWALEEERQGHQGSGRHSPSGWAAALGALHDTRKPHESRRSLQPKCWPCGAVPGDRGWQDNLRQGGPLPVGHPGQQHRRQ